MTEAEWLTSTNAWRMLSCWGKASDRQNRLVVIACCRTQEVTITQHKLNAAALDAAERHADGLLAASTLRKYKHRVSRGRDALPGGDRLSTEHQTANLIVLALTPFGSAGFQPVPNAVLIEIHAGNFSPQVQAYLPGIFRDIFGNPFRPVAIDPAWRTATVLALAEGIYADRAFDRLPILADALQEAGCDNADVLDHCRGPGPHARGCWVVDLILGKT